MNAAVIRSRENAAAWRKQRPLAVRAANHLWMAIHDGKIPRPENAGPCVDCGKRAQVYDHRDYTKPLDVVPVCRGCNNKRGPGYPYIGAEAVRWAAR